MIAKHAATAKHAAQFALTTCFAGACAALGFAAYAAIADAQTIVGTMPTMSGSGAVPYIFVQNPSGSLTLPQTPEAPVSPVTPGTLPGTMAGGGLSVGTNPITGLPCAGAGSTALSGAGNIGEIGTPDTAPEGLPPGGSVFGSGTSLGAC